MFDHIGQPLKKPSLPTLMENKNLTCSSPQNQEMSCSLWRNLEEDKSLLQVSDEVSNVCEVPASSMGLST